MSRVLVVDDEPDVLLLCRLNLQQRGHELLEATDGSTAFSSPWNGTPTWSCWI